MNDATRTTMTGDPPIAFPKCSDERALDVLGCARHCFYTQHLSRSGPIVGQSSFSVEPLDKLSPEVRAGHRQAAWREIVGEAQGRFTLALRELAKALGVWSE